MAFFTMLYQVSLMFLLMAVGWIVYRAGILSETACKGVTRLLMLVVSPAVIVFSFQIRYNASLLRGLALAAAAAAGTHLLGILLGQAIFNKHTTGEAGRKVLRFAVAYSNCGFMGIPLTSALLGKEGVFYLSVYIAVFNIFCWTHGVILFTGKAEKHLIKKLALNPNIIAVAAGLVLFSFSARLPGLLYDGMQYICDLNTPLAMIVIGARLAQVEFRTLLTDRRVLPGALLRNLAVPLMMLFAMHFAGIGGVLLMACLVPAACPVAGNTVLFADLYGGDTSLPTRLVSVSTLLSVVTLPLIVYIVTILKY